MRCLLLLLAVAITSVVSAQAETDTTYNRWGGPEQIRYYSLINVENLSKSERFMRGISAGDRMEPIRQLDSICVYKQDGTIKSLTKGEMKELLSYSPRPVKHTDLRTEGKKANEISTATDYVEGRAGMLVRRKIPQPAKGKSVKDIKRLDESPEIELIDNLEGENGEIIAKVRIPAGATHRKLIIDFGDGEKWEKLYTFRGYHLNETDFKYKDQLTEEQTWHAKGQYYLYLRLRSTEKLLYISQGETRYEPVPVGRQLDEVDLKGLATGKYLLEIIDLGSGEKRYHWLVIGD